MRLTHDRQFMVTCSQDHCKFWCVSDIPTFAADRVGAVLSKYEVKEDKDDEEEMRKRKRRRRKRKRVLVPSDSHSKPVNDFFNDLLL